MNTLKNVVPTLDAQGRLISLKFTASVTNKNDQEFTQDVEFTDQFALPAAGLDQDGNTNAYTPAELDIFAQAHAEQMGVFQNLATQALSATTPIFDPASQPPPLVLTLDQIKERLMANVDNSVADVSAVFTRFQMEYEAREKTAQDFKIANYEGDPTSWVSSFAVAANMTNQQAADLILQQATQLREAVRLLGDERMRKYGILTAPTEAIAQGLHDQILSSIATIQANLP